MITQIFVCEMHLYLFGSHLRLKSQYKFLGIIQKYINNSNFSKYPLKLKKKELPFKILVALTYF
jgi:hypothetical protein